MPQQGNKYKWIKRVFVAAAIAWIVIVFAGMIWDFIFHNDGIAFYARRPYMIGLCVVVAIVAGLIIKSLESRGLLRRSFHALLLLISALIIAVLPLWIFFILSHYNVIDPYSTFALGLIHTSTYLFYSVCALGVYLIIKFLFLYLKYPKKSGASISDGIMCLSAEAEEKTRITKNIEQITKNS
jgi:hypothetical protein